MYTTATTTHTHTHEKLLIFGTAQRWRIYISWNFSLMSMSNVCKDNGISKCGIYAIIYGIIICHAYRHFERWKIHIMQLTWMLFKSQTFREQFWLGNNVLCQSNWWYAVQKIWASVSPSLFLSVSLHLSRCIFVVNVSNILNVLALLRRFSNNKH